MQFNVTKNADKGLGHGLNTINCQHSQVSPVIGQGLNPVQIDQFVDSELTGAQYMINHSDDTTSGNENMDCNGSVNSSACKYVPDICMGLDPINHINKVVLGSHLVNQDSMNSPLIDMARCEGITPLYDANSVGVEEKFANSIIHFQQLNKSQVPVGADSPIFKKWSEQSDFQFGFIPLGEQIMPHNLTCNTNKILEELLKDY